MNIEKNIDDEATNSPVQPVDPENVEDVSATANPEDNQVQNPNNDAGEGQG